MLDIHLFEICFTGFNVLTIFVGTIYRLDDGFEVST